ncbi:TetR family transcriptional regulator [Rathayibacter sp. AY1D2]|nr:TetR family transcriptional regulator [Rathayibacter sp. AY1D2]
MRYRRYVISPTPPTDTRLRIVEAAAGLLRDEGPAAVTTRAVAQAAGLQAPAIYRLFGDKDGLLEAVAEHVLATWVDSKARTVEAAVAGGVDPVEDLRAGWAAQVEFGLANPALFRLLSDPGRASGSPAALSGRRVLAARVQRVAAEGRLRVPEERAVGLIQAAGTGVVTTLLSTPAADRDPGLADAALDSVLAGILTDPPSPGDGGRLTALVGARALAPELAGLTPAERLLLADWLDRALAAAAQE